MLIGIDGTGPSDDGAYSKEMARSFIHQLVDAYPGKNRVYLRGPTLLGEELPSIAETALAAIKGWAERGDRRIHVAGYSRGGAAAIMVAKVMRHYSWSAGLCIECLALFDAVDRVATTPSAVTIPNNVKNAYHARRDPNVFSRSHFGNCARAIDPPSRLAQRFFFATHAGMGGMPWTGDHPLAVLPTVSPPVPQPSVSVAPPVPGVLLQPTPAIAPTICREQDIASSAKVKEWMWHMVRRHGMVH